MEQSVGVYASSLVQSASKSTPIIAVKYMHLPQPEVVGQWSQEPTMETIRHKTSSQSASKSDKTSADSSSRKGRRDGKGRWLSQIKDWVLTSEPSNQALKNYKKDAFRRAGTTPNDPRAAAKLQIQATTLPPEAIKPSGPGPDPEVIAKRKADQKRKLRQSFQTTGSLSVNSRTSNSQHSLSLSSLRLKELKEDA